MNFIFLRIPVYIHPSFWLLLVMFSGIINGLSITALFYSIIICISLFIHEYGHGLTALYFGAHPKIELNIMGGITSYNNNLSERQNFLITLNGPLLESLLIFISYALLKSHFFNDSYINYFLYLTMKINLFWCLVNLIPLYPLDGGHILKYLLESNYGERGFKLSITIGNICAILGAIYFFIHQFLMIGCIFIFYGIQNFNKQKQYKRFYPSNDFTIYNQSQSAVQENDLKKAKNILKRLIKKSNSNNIRISAIESLADILIKEKKPDTAYKLLLKTDHSQLKKGKCLLCRLAYNEKNYSLIEKYSDEIYSIDPSEDIAILNSKTFASLNKPELSGGWLKTAVLFENINAESLQGILNDPIYDSVRKNDTFNYYLKDIKDSLKC